MDFAGSRFDRLCDAVEKVIARNEFTDSLDVLLTKPHQRGPFVERLTAELTIGESFFFRNEHHFRAMREQVIPEILQDNGNRGDVRIWSAGCSTGEEPHSLAILFDQMLSDQNSRYRHQKWQISILATDINTEFLQRARVAEYRNWSFRRTDIHLDTRYFTKSGDKFCLRPAVRESVRFVYLNLVKDVYPSPLTGTAGLDLILFRNVAIYLHAEVIAAIVARFNRCLRPGGWLLLGEAEVSQIQPVGFDVRRIGQATFFQKPRHGTPATLINESPRAVLPPAYDTEPSVGVVVPPPPFVAPFDPERLVVEPGIQSHGNGIGQNQWSTQSIPAPSSKAPPTPAPPATRPAFDWEKVEGFLLRENYDAAEREFALIRDQNQRAKMKLKFVRRLLEVSQTTCAREMLDACLDDQPLMIDAHLLKASLAEERGELAQAEAACRRALYLDRTCAIAHFHLALVQQQAGDAMGARKSLQSVQKLADSHDASALVDHGDGVCYGRLWELAQSMMGS